MKLNQDLWQFRGVERSARALSLCISLLLLSFSHAYGQKQGHDLVDSLLKNLEKAQNDSARVRILTQASMHCKNFNPNDGIKYGYEALDLASSMNWKKGIALSYGSLAANFSSKSDDVKVLEYLFRELKLAEELHDTKDIAGVLSNIGIVYQSQDNMHKALEYYLKGLKMLEKVGDTLSLAILYGNIATVHLDQKEYDKALEYNMKALTLSNGIDDNIGIATYMEVIGDIYNAEKKYDSAIEYELKALRISEQMGDSTNIATCLGYLGVYHLNMAQDEGAQYKHGQHLQIGKSAMIKLAIGYLTKAIRICRNIGFLDGVQDFSKHLSIAQEAAGNYPEALARYKEYMNVKDSVFSMESKMNITRLETRRELDLKEKQIEIDKLAVAKKRNERVFYIAGIGLLLLIIANVFRNFKVQKGLNKLLQVEKQKVEERSEELRYSNTELSLTLKNLQDTQHQLIITEKQKENEVIRSRISQDIHDDISSELTKISWISALAKAKAKKEDIKEVTTLLDKISGYSQDTVAKLGEIIWTVNPKNDNLDSMFAYMRNYTAKFLADTSFNYRVSFPENKNDVLINPELKRNLFLVLKEALHNAVKYSEASEINISCDLENSRYAICISDNGKGLDEGVVHGSGNGLGNMRKRMETVKGNIEITSRPGNGTHIVLSGSLY